MFGCVAFWRMRSLGNSVAEDSWLRKVAKNPKKMMFDSIVRNLPLLLDAFNLMMVVLLYMFSFTYRREPHQYIYPEKQSHYLAL